MLSYIQMPCMFRHILYIWMPQYVQTPSICPQCSPVHLHVLGVSACDLGMWGPLSVGTPPMCLDVSPCVQLPHICMLPCMPVCSRDYLHVLWGKHPICWELGGISTSVRLLVSVNTSFGCPLCFILYLSCSSLCLKFLLPWL